MDKARKDDQEKPDLSLIPYSAQVEEARAFMLGANKYGQWNYLKGHTATQLTSAALRHINQWLWRQDQDPESGASHLGHARACLGMLIEQQQAGVCTDDRPVVYQQQQQQQQQTSDITITNSHWEIVCPATGEIKSK